MPLHYVVSRLDATMLQTIDGTHKSRIEFEERARLRTLRMHGVRVSVDDAGIMRVDWTTVHED